MEDQITQFLAYPGWRDWVLPILLALLGALIVRRISPALAARASRFNRFTTSRVETSPEREKTLRSLLASFITFFGFVAAFIFSVGLFVDADTLVWFVGLFSAAFGLGARPLVNDYLAGISFIFGNTFNVGETVEILDVEGVIEAVNIRETVMRSPTGEIYVIPNGEIRVVRNFSRGQFSKADVSLKVRAADVDRALDVLIPLGEEAVQHLPNLIAPWRVINTTGAVGQHAELTLLARARWGHAAEMRPRMLALIQDRLSAAGIEMAD